MTDLQSATSDSTPVGGGRASQSGRAPRSPTSERKARVRLSQSLPRHARRSEAEQRRLAVVLSGGGARGAFEVGAIDVLAAGGIVPDLLVGISVGVINAAFWAFHPGPDVGQRLLHLWAAADRRMMLPSGLLGVLASVLRGHDHLVQRRSITRLLERSFSLPAQIEDSPVPLAVVATDLLRGELVRLRTGPLLPALLASSAIPGLFPPERIDGRVLVDGGLLANCDIAAAVAAGATDVIAVDLATDQSQPTELNLLRVVELSVALTLRRQTERGLARLARAARVVIVRPVFERGQHIGQFDATNELFAHGQMAGRQLLATHINATGRVRPGLLTVHADGTIDGDQDNRLLAPWPLAPTAGYPETTSLMQ
jgi:NTE family protein